MRCVEISMRVTGQDQAPAFVSVTKWTPAWKTYAALKPSTLPRSEDCRRSRVTVQSRIVAAT